MEIAYAVRSSYADDGYEAGDVAVGDETYHLGAELKKGHGYVICESDSLVQVRLAEQLALEQVDVEVARKAQKPPKAEAKSTPTTTEKEG